MSITYACRCRNVRVAAEQEAAHQPPADLTLSFVSACPPPPAELASALPFPGISAHGRPAPKLTRSSSVRSQVLEDMAKRDDASLQCLICGDVVHKAAADGQVELVAELVSPDAEPVRII